MIQSSKLKYRRGKILDLELLRKKLDSGIYLDHAIETIAESLAETLNEEGFIIIHKAEKENGGNLCGHTPSTLSNTSH
jgi:hypothetical protein